MTPNQYIAIYSPPPSYRKPHQASNGMGPKTAELRPGLRCRAGGQQGPQATMDHPKQQKGEGEEGEAGREVRALGIRPETKKSPCN